MKMSKNKNIWVSSKILCKQKVRGSQKKYVSQPVEMKNGGSYYVQENTCFHVSRVWAINK